MGSVARKMLHPWQHCPEQAERGLAHKIVNSIILIKETQTTTWFRPRTHPFRIGHFLRAGMVRQVVRPDGVLQLGLVPVELFPAQRAGRDRLIFAERFEHAVGHGQAGHEQGK